MSATLMLHAGGRLVTLDELDEVKAPDPVGRWFPLAHHSVLRIVRETLVDAGFEVRKEQFALAKQDNRFFGTLDLGTPLSEGVSLSVGVRNSFDKSFPLSFCAGSRVFVCDNLAFRAELLVKRKHTRFGEMRFANDIAGAMLRLNQFKEEEGKRIDLMRCTEVENDRADSLILRAMERGIIPAQAISKVLKHWRKPEHEEFHPRTHWSLFNAFTSALGERALSNPHTYATLTMRLNAHLTPNIPAIAA
jgi:hypothetical protein